MKADVREISAYFLIYFPVNWLLAASKINFEAMTLLKFNAK
jgi:hypothetical protein